MKAAYFDCFAGAAGDMILGSLVDAGLELDALKKALAGLGLTHFDLGMETVLKNGISGARVLVHVDEEYHTHHHRRLHDIEDIVAKSDLDKNIKKKSIEIFGRLARAEAAVHQTSVEEIHFHEVGAMDAIIDVVGSVVGIAALGVEKVFCSPLHVGTGTVTCAHGVLPVPAPATAELVKGKPIYSTGVEGELLTPTGAAILTTLSSDFGPMPPMSVEKIGYGAGTADRAIPNLLRLFIGKGPGKGPGEGPDEAGGWETDRMAVVETGVDDMDPRVYDHVFRKLLAMGAVDVFLTPAQMKKNRPGVLLTALCPPALVERVADFLMRETTTIGVRWRVDNRIKASRSIHVIDTEYGPIRVKAAMRGADPINIMPEYEDCKEAARKHGAPLKSVLEAAKAAAWGENPSKSAKNKL